MGFVTAISFMEAPVKFKTPTLSLPVGLDVGRRVFGVLNKIELMFAVISLIGIFINSFNPSIFTLFIVIVFILLMQTFWLLPKLNKRAELYVSGNKPRKSKVHLSYVIFELVKIISLFWMGILQISF